MAACTPDVTHESLRELALLPGAIYAGLSDRAAASLAWSDAEGTTSEAPANVRVLVEAMLTAGGALCDACAWDAPKELRIAATEGALLIHRVDDQRALVLLHDAAASSPRLALALREAASRLPPARSETAKDRLTEMPVF